LIVTQNGVTFTGFPAPMNVGFLIWPALINASREINQSGDGGDDGDRPNEA